MILILILICYKPTNQVPSKGLLRPETLIFRLLLSRSLSTSLSPSLSLRLDRQWQMGINEMKGRLTKGKDQNGRLTKGRDGIMGSEFMALKHQQRTGMVKNFMTR
jgi:hypothetical protein